MHANWKPSRRSSGSTALLSRRLFGSESRFARRTAWAFGRAIPAMMTRS